jgi:hypothetical protein
MCFSLTGWFPDTSSFIRNMHLLSAWLLVLIMPSWIILFFIQKHNSLTRTTKFLSAMFLFIGLMFLLIITISYTFFETYILYFEWLYIYSFLAILQVITLSNHELKN